MKRTLLLIALLFSSYAGFSQSLIAKLKYEDAEAAYLKEDYKEALTKLDEAEAILKASNPRILYLRVMTQYKMIEKSPVDFALIESTRALSSDYLAKYETVPNNEDKFRDIYKASEALNRFPKTAAEFTEQAAAKKAEIERYSIPANSLQGLYDQFKFKLDMTVEDFINYNPDAKAFLATENPLFSSKGDKYWSEYKALKGVTDLTSRNNKVIQYGFVITNSSDNVYLDKVFKDYSNVLATFIKPITSTDINIETSVFIRDKNIYISVKKDDGRVLIRFVEYNSI